MTPPNPNDKILSYGDVVLRRSDLEILRSPFFINDRLIEFYFTHLSSSHPSAATRKGRLLLVPPSISFWLSNCPNTPSRTEVATPLGLQGRDLVLFTVNNNDDLTMAEGGSHWSLLVYERGDNVFVHHDSCNGMNNHHARHMYDAVKSFFGGDTRFMVWRTPQQRNGYDCGVYVMAVARVISNWFENGKEGDEKWLKKLEMEVHEEAVASLRLELLDLIASLRGRE
ncbi:NEDD8-specific protease 1 [Phalaenopsis equestris]|uniref:NEDD8-specific protease 1 n=1 Tax=Phalaenopsis equestris TaxID=78828 RepID=UPI0009E1CAF4|nr:NEDD8-specific protease 1 [Phalaenopsis equestris]